jgi:plastocyanin
MSLRSCVRVFVTAGALICSAPALSAERAVREFYIVTVHHDGKTNLKGDATHRPEVFPQKPFASTRGMWVKEPAENGDWTVRAFVFDPAEVTVQQGDEVRLHFVGVHGDSHTISVEGVAGPVIVKRGNEQIVSFKAERQGLIGFMCSDHPPSMRGQVVVLPKN